MKVLMIAPQPFLEPRGTPISVYQRLSGLSSLGHSVDLVTYHLGDDVSFPGVRIFRIPAVPFIKQLRVGPSWPKLLLDLLIFIRAFTRLVGGKYDLIHSHEEAGMIGVFLAKIFDVPHLYDMHSSLPQQLENFDFGNYRPVVRLFELCERWVIRQSSAVITIGPDLEARVKGIYPDGKQVMIENLPLRLPANLSEDGAAAGLRSRLGAEDKLVIVYAGTFERYQGVHLLVESAAQVLQAHPQVMFILVGGKPHQVEALRREAHRLNLDHQIYFPGTLSLDESNLYLEMADILVSCRIEGTSVPLKIYTYLGMGKPIVATQLPAHTLVLNDQNAILVEPTAEGFASGFLRLIENPELRLCLGQEAQKLAREKYSMTGYLEKLDRIYRMVQPVLPVAAQQKQTEKGRTV